MSTTSSELSKLYNTGIVRERANTFKNIPIKPSIEVKPTPSRTNVADIASKFKKTSSSTRSPNKPISTGAELSIEDIKPHFIQKKKSPKTTQKSKPKSKSRSKSKSKSRSKSRSKPISRYSDFVTPNQWEDGSAIRFSPLISPLL